MGGLDFLREGSWRGSTGLAWYRATSLIKARRPTGCLTHSDPNTCAAHSEEECRRRHFSKGRSYSQSRDGLGLEEAFRNRYLSALASVLGVKTDWTKVHKSNMEWKKLCKWIVPLRQSDNLLQFGEKREKGGVEGEEEDMV